MHILPVYRGTLGRVKKISCLSSEIFDEIRAGGRIFLLFFIYSGCGLCEQSRGPLRNGRLQCTVRGGVGDGQYWVCSLHVAYID